MTTDNHPKNRTGARRLLATCAVALPLLTALGSAEADTLRDTENNNVKANQSTSMYVGNMFTNVKGTLGISDSRDLYSFTDSGTPRGEFDVYWQKVSGNSSLEIYKDLNKNKRLDSSDRLVSKLTRGSEGVTIWSAPNMMFLVVPKYVGGPRTSKYSFHVSVPTQVKLTVHKARSFGKFDNGDPGDFYVTTTLRHLNPKKSKVIQNDDTPSFNHSHIATAHETVVPFEIDLIDKDSKGRFSRRNQDDRADINPSPKAKKLSLTYNLISHQVRTSDGKYVGTSGSTSKTIKMKGDKKGDQVEVEFSITR